MSEKKIRAKITGAESETAYIALPGYPSEPQSGLIAKTISLDDIFDELKGPRVNLDFNRDGVLIGIEILA